MDNYQIKEYEQVRNEINEKINLHNTLLTFTVTTSIAILSFALTQDNALFYLMPLGVLIPMSLRIAYYVSAMAKLSAYIIVFLEPDLEGIDWESRNILVIENRLKREQLRKRDRIGSFTNPHYYECFILTILSYAMYVVKIVTDTPTEDLIRVSFLWPVPFVLLELWIIWKINSFNKAKRSWIKDWRDLKEKERFDNNSL